MERKSGIAHQNAIPQILNLKNILMKPLHFYTFYTFIFPPWHQNYRLHMDASTEGIIFLHQSTTWSVSKARFLLILTTPNSVVCSLSKWFSNSLFCIFFTQQTGIWETTTFRQSSWQCLPFWLSVCRWCSHLPSPSTSLFFDNPFGWKTRIPLPYNS